MVILKHRPPTPFNSRNQIIVEKRIVHGINRKVETFNGDIVRVFDSKGKVIEDRSAGFGNELPLPPYVRPKQKIEEIPKIDQDKKEEISGTGSGMQLVSSEDTGQYSRSYLANTKNMTPKSEEVANVDVTTPKSEDVTNVDVTTPKSEDVTNVDVAPKSEDITNVDVAPKSEDITNVDVAPKSVTNADVAPKSEDITNVDVAPKSEDITNVDVMTPKEGDAAYVPKIEPIIPKIISKSEPQKEEMEIHKDVPIPDINIPVIDRLSKIMKEKTKEDKTSEDKERSSNITKLESPKAETPKDVPKAETPKEISKETLKIEQSKIKKDSDQLKLKTVIPKEVKRMAEEKEEEEIMQERKFEKWLKKNRFQESVEKTAKITEENQGQIKDISNEITNVKDGLGGVENRIDNLKEGLNSILGETKKPITETLGGLCNDVDCIKNDVAKYQGVQSDLDKKLDTRFSELRERIQKLEEPTFTCDNCGADSIRPLSSFCSNCGSPIHSWNDDSGVPVKGWVPYWRRAQA